MQTNLHIVAKRPELKAAVQDEILKFIKEWRSVYGAQEAQGTAALLLNSGAIDYAVLFSLQQVVERALQTVPQAPGQNATPVARAGAMMTYPAVATNATAIQKQAHQQTCLRMDQELLTLLEQYYSRNGGDSLLIAVRKACVFPQDVPSYSNALAAYSDLVVKAIIKGGCPAGGPQTVDAAMASVPDQRPYVKAVIEGMKEKASWMVQFQSGKYPTVMSLLKAIHDDIHFCHSNQERLGLKYCDLNSHAANMAAAATGVSPNAMAARGVAASHVEERRCKDILVSARLREGHVLRWLWCRGAQAEKLPGPSLPRGVVATHGAEGEEGFERSLRFQVW